MSTLPHSDAKSGHFSWILHKFLLGASVEQTLHALKGQESLALWHIVHLEIHQQSLESHKTSADFEALLALSHALRLKVPLIWKAITDTTPPRSRLVYFADFAKETPASLTWTRYLLTHQHVHHQTELLERSLESLEQFSFPAFEALLYMLRSYLPTYSRHQALMLRTKAMQAEDFLELLEESGIICDLSAAQALLTKASLAWNEYHHHTRQLEQASTALDHVRWLLPPGAFDKAFSKRLCQNALNEIQAILRNDPHGCQHLHTLTQHFPPSAFSEWMTYLSTYRDILSQGPNIHVLWPQNRR